VHAQRTDYGRKLYTDAAAAAVAAAADGDDDGVGTKPSQCTACQCD